MANEIMSMEQLDAFSGGTNGEYKELREILPKMGMKGRYRTVEEVEEWLKVNLKIDAKIDIGGWWNPSSSAGEKNVYIQNGKRLTHSKVIAEIKNFGY